MILSTCVLDGDSERMDYATDEYSVIFPSIFHGDKITFTPAGNFIWRTQCLKQELRLWLAWKYRLISSGPSAVSFPVTSTPV